jgi:hypothetical protein
MFVGKLRRGQNPDSAFLTAWLRSFPTETLAEPSSQTASGKGEPD